MDQKPVPNRVDFSGWTQADYQVSRRTESVRCRNPLVPDGITPSVPIESESAKPPAQDWFAEQNIDQLIAADTAQAERDQQIRQQIADLVIGIVGQRPPPSPTPRKNLYNHPASNQKQMNDAADLLIEVVRKARLRNVGLAET